MLVIDAHLDLSMNALQWNRNLLESVYTIRAGEAGMPGKGRASGTVALPELREGQVALSFATLLARSTGQKVEHLDYGSQAQSYGMAMGQLAYYRALEMDGQVRILEDGTSLREHIAEWENWEAAGADLRSTPPLGFVISMEGADPIRNPAQLETWWEAGLRLLGPHSLWQRALCRRHRHRARIDRIGRAFAARDEAPWHVAGSDAFF